MIRILVDNPFLYVYFQRARRACTTFHQDAYINNENETREESVQRACALHTFRILFRNIFTLKERKDLSERFVWMFRIILIRSEM